MDERTTIENEFGHFTIENLNGNYSVYGNGKAIDKAFKEIGRRPPNEYGNFFGRKKAGFAACRELVEKAQKAKTR